MITFENVGLKLGNVQILENLNFSVEKGEFICLLGPSGCGKSTILRLIGDLLEGSTGSIQVAGELPGTGWEKNRLCFPKSKAPPMEEYPFKCGFWSRNAVSAIKF